MSEPVEETKSENVNIEMATDQPSNPDVIRVRCLTWNVGNTQPNFEELKHTLNLEELTNHDLIVVGTQENAYGGQTLKEGHTASKLDVLSLKTEASNHQLTVLSSVKEQKEDPDEPGKYSSEGAAREWSTVVDISIPPSSFKPVSLSLSRSPLSKTPKQVFFNPINIFDSFTHSITVLEAVEVDQAVEVEVTGEEDEEKDDTTARRMTELRQNTIVNNEWEAELCKHMGDEWTLLEKQHLGEMKLLVLIHTGSDDSSVWSGRNVAVSVQNAYSCCGIAGVGNNKGGIVISFHVRNTYLSFISAHLNAHMEHEAKRNADHQEIRRETSAIGNSELDPCTDVDHCVWMGDLNYRVDLDRGDPECPPSKKNTKKKLHLHWDAVSELIEEKKWSKILDHDQLNLSKKEGLAWHNFEEGDITFAPTFKVLKDTVGTTYKQQRVSAYCDRVLWKSAPHAKGRVKATNYRGVPAVSTSDHKPVICDLEIATSQPPSAVYSFQAGGRRKKHRGSFSGGLSSDMDYFQNRRSKVWPVVEITNLKAVDIIASDLDLRGRTSDPYVEFHANPTDLLWHHPHKLHQQTGKGFFCVWF